MADAEPPGRRRRPNAGNANAFTADDLREEQVRRQERAFSTPLAPLPAWFEKKTLARFAQQAPPQAAASVVQYRNERGWRTSIERYVNSLRQRRIITNQGADMLWNPVTKTLHSAYYADLAIIRFVGFNDLAKKRMSQAYLAMLNGFLMPWTYMNMALALGQWQLKPGHLDLLGMMEVKQVNWRAFVGGTGNVFPADEPFFRALAGYGTTMESQRLLVNRMTRKTWYQVNSFALDRWRASRADLYGINQPYIKNGYNMYTEDFAARHTYAEDDIYRLDTESNVIRLIYADKDVLAAAARVHVAVCYPQDVGFPGVPGI